MVPKGEAFTPPQAVLPIRVPNISRDRVTQLNHKLSSSISVNPLKKGEANQSSRIGARFNCVLWRELNVAGASSTGAAHWYSHRRHDGVIARKLEHGDSIAQRGGLELKGYIHLSARRDIYR